MCTEEIQAKTDGWTTQTVIYCDIFWLQSFGIRNSYLAHADIYVLPYSFCFALFWIWGKFPSTSPQRPVFGGAIYRRFFFWRYEFGGLYLEGLYMDGAYFRNFTVGWSSPVEAWIISLVPLVNILDVKTLLSWWECSHLQGFLKSRHRDCNLCLKQFSSPMTAWWLATPPTPIQYFRQCHLCHRIVCNHLSRSHPLLHA